MSEIYISPQLKDKRFVTQNGDPILLALMEHLNIERCGGPAIIKERDEPVILYNTGINRTKNRELWQWCKANKRQCYVMERGSLPNTSIIDPCGLLSESSSYNAKQWNCPLSSSEQLEIRNYVQLLTTSTDSLEKQVAQSDINNLRNWLPSGFKQIVFVPLQKEADTVIVMWSRWVQDVHGFRKVISDLAKQFYDVLFLIKPHPLSQHQSVEQTHNVRNVINFNYKDCLSVCDKVFLINSGVGLQALAWRKPTYVFGDCHYNVPGANRQVNSYEDAVVAIQENWNVDIEMAERFLHYIKFRFWSDCDLSNGAKQCKYRAIRTIHGV